MKYLLVLLVLVNGVAFADSLDDVRAQARFVLQMPKESTARNVYQEASERELQRTRENVERIRANNNSGPFPGVADSDEVVASRNKSYSDAITALESKDNVIYPLVPNVIRLNPGTNYVDVQPGYNKIYVNY